MTEDEHSVYFHPGCKEEAGNWAYDPSEDDSGHSCEVCGAMVDHEGQWCPRCQKGA